MSIFQQLVCLFSIHKSIEKPTSSRLCMFERHCIYCIHLKGYWSYRLERPFLLDWFNYDVGAFLGDITINYRQDLYFVDKQVDFIARSNKLLCLGFYSDELLLIISFRMVQY
eukprot:TRINITY_DN12108_c0_g1_i1.p5 TRINITY_DN12108_c0_g1~~TRINITY_DN12108_c0_g1_i1.p5  ORF type:complete len:112 (-),score=4.92 TRINITY_DN12108_c0_g1_i1:590-925(-)